MIKKVEHLIVDTSAFINNTSLQDIGVNIITEENVLSEITNKRQLKRLVVLPYNLIVKQAFAEDIKIVSDFAKKTGDYISLSATDIKVMAIAYRIHVENIGKDTIKSEPETPKIKDIATLRNEQSFSLIGFYDPKKKNTEIINKEPQLKDSHEKLKQLLKELGITDDTETQNNSEKSKSEMNCDVLLQSAENCNKDVAESIAKLECNAEDLEDDYKNEQDMDDILTHIKYTDINESESSNEENDDDDNDDDDDDDDEGWITPQNIKQVKKNMMSDVVEDEPASVACLTTDFAMQNVLKQMGLHIVTIDGKLIKQLRTFILRCYACFRTTSVMTKLFCPHCGMKTLKKVSVALNENGELQMFINYKKKISARGKRFSLPTPKGGKHAVNPILREDQRIPHQRVSKSARQKNNPLHEDWIAGYSPFLTKDVTSRSAMLGIRPELEMKYWMRRNPNEVRKKAKKNRK